MQHLKHMFILFTLICIATPFDISSLFDTEKLLKEITGDGTGSPSTICKKAYSGYEAVDPTSYTLTSFLDTLDTSTTDSELEIIKGILINQTISKSEIITLGKSVPKFIISIVFIALTILSIVFINCTCCCKICCFSEKKKKKCPSHIFVFTLIIFAGIGIIEIVSFTKVKKFNGYFNGSTCQIFKFFIHTLFGEDKGVEDLDKYVEEKEKEKNETNLVLYDNYLEENGGNTKWIGLANINGTLVNVSNNLFGKITDSLEDITSLSTSLSTFDSEFKNHIVTQDSYSTMTLDSPLYSGQTVTPI